MSHRGCILSQSGSILAVGGDASAAASAPRPPLTPRSSAKQNGVMFSPYNMVKLIPAKEHSEMYKQYREPSWDDIWDGDEEDAAGCP